MGASVTILHGPVRSGKTTLLTRWADERTDMGGVLQPDTPTGRSFRNVASEQVEALEPAGADEAVLTVGRFRFRQHAFDRANEWLRAGASGSATLIVDEIGPLELAGDGLYAGLRAALARPDASLILVVRSPLLNAVQKAFGLDQARLVAAIDWPQAGQGVRSVP